MRIEQILNPETFCKGSENQLSADDYDEFEQPEDSSSSSIKKNKSLMRLSFKNFSFKKEFSNVIQHETVI